jgi:hypothetical protein
LTYGRPAFVIWQYSVTWPLWPDSQQHATRSVYLLPGGTLAFDAERRDEPDGYDYNGPMVKLAQTSDQLTYLDLRVEHFGLHGANGFDRQARALLEESSR